MRLFNRYLVFVIMMVCMPAATMADVAVIVHPSNPVDSLSHKQVQKLFLGRALMFPRTETKVYSIDQNESSPEYSFFYENVIKMKLGKLKKYRAYYLFSGKGRLPLPMNDSQEIVDKVSVTENAISYINAIDVSDKVKVVYSMP